MLSIKDCALSKFVFAVLYSSVSCSFSSAETMLLFAVTAAVNIFNLPCANCGFWCPVLIEIPKSGYDIW